MATGGAGAAETVLNAVTGSTAGGSLTLTQSATGGAGGVSAGGTSGAGGAASSTLSHTDTTSASLIGTTNATGGAGGISSFAGKGGAGGAATSTLTLSGKASVSAASANAVGGASGRADPGGLPAAGGAATASDTATSTAALTASSSATGGAGAATGGLAAATTTATGVSGSWSATASSSTVAGNLVQTVSAVTQGSVDDKSVGVAKAGVNGAGAAFLKADEGVAFITGEPSSATTSAVLTANAAIKTAFGASPTFFGVGELGGAYSFGGKNAQVTTSTISETVDLTQLASRQDLVVGFYDGSTVGTGVTGVTFNLFVDGIDVDSKSFATAAAAQTYFTNNAVDLGSLASGSTLVGTNNILTVSAVLTVASDKAASGFYGDIIVGDPPATQTPVAPQADSVDPGPGQRHLVLRAGRRSVVDQPDPPDGSTDGGHRPPHGHGLSGGQPVVGVKATGMLLMA